MKICIILSSIALIFLLCLGCSGTETLSPVSTVTNPLPSSLAVTSQTATNAPGKTVALLLALYFLAGSPEGSQVWRLGMEDLYPLQVTHEKSEVDAFSVSITTGKIAFTSDNRLFLMDGDGQNRVLIADGHSVDETVEDYFFRSQVSSPSFSPDGELLAYGFDGLHLYDLTTGRDTHVLTNLGNLLGEPFVFSKEAYVPGPWSPDGSHLLIIMSYYEGSTLAVMDIEAEQPFNRLWSDGPVCCQYSWSPDGSSVLVANPYYTMDIPGLWRYDAVTGEGRVLIAGLSEDGSSNFIGWPFQLGSGELLFFHVNEFFSPDIGIPLRMTRSDSQGLNLLQVRPDVFHISSILWTQDGGAAFIVQSSSKDEMQIILAKTDGSPLYTVFEGQGVRNLAWGP